MTTYPTNAGIVLCYGAGVDSTAMILGMHDRGEKADLISFADTGGEKPETYEYLDIMDAWLADHGWPSITRVKKLTLESTAYNCLGGNCENNETLPSLAFGMKSCSIKWKQGPQDVLLKGATRGPNKCDPHPLWTQAQDRGVKLVKLIGYDGSPADIRRSKKVKTEDSDFLYHYPLQEWEWKREDCIARIIEEGLPVPIKSACWFCPASQKWELWWLAGKHPDLFMRALDMEHTAMTGKHSRWGSDDCTYDKDWVAFVNKPAKQWPTTGITVGLGRSFSWNHWARENGIVDRETGELIPDPARYLRRSEEIRAAGGNAADARSCGIGQVEMAI